MSVLAEQLTDPLSLVRDVSPGGMNLRRFQCLPGCGLCCSYKVSLLKADIAALELAGLPASEFVDTVRRPASGLAACIAKRDGFCLFLDERRRCRVYEHRPLYCRLYPYVRESHVHTQLDVSLSCPGVGQGPELSDEELLSVLELDGSAADQEKLVARRNRTTEMVRGLTRFRARLEPFEEIVGSIHSAAGDGLQGLCGFLDAKASPRINGILPSGNGPPAGRGSLLESADAMLRDYLLLWSRRQTLWRWADAFLAAVPAVASRSQAVFSLLLDAADAVTAAAGHAAEGADIDGPEILNAIRQCDSGFRTYCHRYRFEATTA